jgi:hypothetical protein
MIRRKLGRRRKVASTICATAGLIAAMAAPASGATSFNTDHGWKIEMAGDTAIHQCRASKVGLAVTYELSLGADPVLTFGDGLVFGGVILRTAGVQFAQADAIDVTDEVLGALNKEGWAEIQHGRYGLPIGVNLRGFREADMLCRTWVEKP